MAKNSFMVFTKNCCGTDGMEWTDHSPYTAVLIVISIMLKLCIHKTDVNMIVSNIKSLSETIVLDPQEVSCYHTARSE